MEDLHWVTRGKAEEGVPGLLGGMVRQQYQQQLYGQQYGQQHDDPNKRARM